MADATALFMGRAKHAAGDSSDAEAFKLLGDEGAAGQEVVPWHDTVGWRVGHVLGFATGGLTFIAGTSLYYFPQTEAIGLAAGILYIVGSVGFLSVDILEFLAFHQCPLRFNISLNAIGSALYVVGSAGFIPSLLTSMPALGLWGFILGSAFIGLSEVWKLVRIATPPDDPTARPSLRYMLSSADALTATGVELGAFFGAWLFFVGSVMDDGTPPPGSHLSPEAWYVDVLDCWLAGSIAFTMGSAFLAYRHFVMGIT